MGNNEIERKLHELERANRRLKWLTLATMTLVAAAGLMAARPTGTPKAIVAESFVLRDQRGVHAVLGLLDQQPQLIFFDVRRPFELRPGLRRGMPVGMVGIKDGSMGLEFSDSEAKKDIELVLFADGPRLTLTDAEGAQAVLGVSGTQKIVTGERHRTSAAALTLFGRDGKLIWKAP